MKNTKLLFSILTLFLLMFTSCDEEEVLINELKLSTYELTLDKGKHEHIKIIDGNGGYKIEVSNENVTAELENGEIHVNAVKEGASIITITDGNGKTKSVKIVVASIKSLKLSVNELTLDKGKHEHIQIIDGNGEYKVEVSNQNVTAKLEGKEIHVDALKEGESVITITDAKGQTASVAVIVKAQVKNNLSLIHRIKVVSQNGHRHGLLFHGNPENKTPLKNNLHTILERDTAGNWKVVKKEEKDAYYVNQGESFVFEGVSFDGGSFNKEYSGVQGYEFIFFDKEGNRLDNKFLEENKVYQNLFSIEKYNELDDDFKSINSVSLSTTKDFFEYQYRDTNPADKMIKSGGEITENYLGLKGYGWIKKNKISFKLKVKFVKFKDENSKVNSIYLEDADTSKIEDEISFEIPIIVPTERDDYDTRIGHLAKYYGMSYDEFEELFWDTAPAESSQYWM